MKSVTLGLFGVVHVDRPKKVAEELTSFAADADALFIEQPETEVTFGTLGRTFVRTPLFFLGLVVQITLLTPLYVVLNRRFEEAEVIAVRRVAEAHDLPIHEVDDHPILYMSRAGPRWMLLNWGVLAALAWLVPLAFFGTVFVLTAAYGLILCTVGYRRLWLLAAIPCTWGVLAFGTAKGLISFGLVAGFLVFFIGSTLRIHAHRNEHMLRRVADTSEREGYERACLVTGKAHLAGLVRLAPGVGVSASRMHVSKWLRASDDVTENPDPESVEVDIDGREMLAVLGFSRPDPLVGTENDVLGRRSGAAIIDSVAAFFVGSAGAVLFALADIAITGDAVASLDVWSGFAVAPFCYFALTEAYFGRTLGKRLFGLVVVAEDGTTASRQSILARNLLRPLDFLPCYGLGVLSMSISQRSQRIGDVAADTVVVRSARGR